MLSNVYIAQHQPASHRLASTPASLGTRPVVLLPRAAKHMIFNLAKKITNCDNGHGRIKTKTL
jgi:hypothetical protein